MDARAGIEGSLSVRLKVSGGTVAEVRLHSSRTMVIGRILAGRPVDEALALVPRLFSLCGMAQGIAALNACERASGIIPIDAQQAARTLLTQAEAVDSHGWQILLIWPRLLGEALDAPALLGLRTATAAIAPALFPDRDWLRPGGGRLRPDRTALAAAVDAIEERIAAIVLGSGARLPETAADLAHDATPAGRLMAWISSTPPAAPAREGPLPSLPPAKLGEGALVPSPGSAGGGSGRGHAPLAEFGRSAVPTLPDLPADWFADRLSCDPNFAALPTLNGIPAETGALARTAAHPIVAELAARHGNGLATRFAARLIDLLDLPRRMRAAIDQLADDDPATPRPSAPGSGAGIADTARGRLAHWIALDAGGRIADWRTVAPNEWNFHPQGALAQGLLNQPADAGLPQRAELLVAALDPCVPCHVSIEES